ncbi:MAG: hypothetical protein AAFQ68_20410 [Bacteroidota bacterium]
MGAIFALLRSPVFILGLVFLILFWYYFQQVNSVFEALRMARKRQFRKEKRQDELWSSYEIWRTRHASQLPGLDLTDIADLQVRERAQESFLKQLQESDPNAELEGWRTSLLDARISVLEERKKFQKLETKWTNLQNRFPHNLLISLLNLDPYK